MIPPDTTIVTIKGLNAVSNGWSGGVRAIVAAQAALALVNQESSPLRKTGFHLTYENFDDECTKDKGMDRFIQLLESGKPDLMLGPSCSSFATPGLTLTPVHPDPNLISNRNPVSIIAKQRKLVFITPGAQVTLTQPMQKMQLIRIKTRV